MKNKNRRLVLSILFLILLMVSLIGCGNQKKNENKITQDAAEVKKTEESITLPKVDRAGNEVTIPKEINSIISLSPSITEIIVEMGYADKIVAIDSNSAGREGIAEDVVIFDMMNPDVEKLAELNSDIVFSGSLNTLNSGENTFKPLTDLGICVVFIPTSESIAAIEEDISFVGQVLQDADTSTKILETMRAEIDKIAAIGKTITEKKSVYFEISAAPSMFSFGSGVFLNEMLNLIGANNVFAEEKGWMSVEAETLLSKNPDVILTSVNYIKNPCDEIAAREGFEEITAVKEGKVYYIDNNSSSLSNQNIIIALKEMAKAVYPDRY